MNENVENLILAQLREIRSEMATMRVDLSAVRSDIADLNQKTDGLTLMVTMLAGHVHGLEARVERLEAHFPGSPA